MTEQKKIEKNKVKNLFFAITTTPKMQENLYVSPAFVPNCLTSPPMWGLRLQVTAHGLDKLCFYHYPVCVYCFFSSVVGLVFVFIVSYCGGLPQGRLY